MYDYHIHSTFSDGQDCPEKIILEAIIKGFSEIGFSDHSRVSFDPFGGVEYDRFEDYKNTIDQLKQKYAGTITVYCGLEQDYFSPAPIGCPDYLIGSMHYVSEKGEFFSVDDTPGIVSDAVNRLYDGDAYAYAEAYFTQMETLLSKTNADIIGHFDLLTRFEQELHLFDPTHPRYRAAWKKAADALLPSGKPFEINTRGLTKQYKSEPYPSLEILQYIASHGGKFVLSSDSHKKEEIGSCFDKYQNMFPDCLIQPSCFKNGFR